MFLPATVDEMRRLGWSALDVILVSGDAYLDCPLVGVAVIGNALVAAGWRVGVIAQPDLAADRDIRRLGEPRLFWGVSAGSIDSMVANYTASGRRRRTDDCTPGGRNDRRPDRACIVYANLIRRSFRHTRPIVLGGIEASLRRIAHYDWWSGRVRRSVLFDAKADILAYGMAERTVVDLARRLDADQDFHDLPGICYAAKIAPDGHCRLPSFEQVRDDPAAFTAMFSRFYRNNEPATARGLFQPHGDRVLVHNPPVPYGSQADLDAVYGWPYEREVHPFDLAKGPVPAIETIRFSLTTHRGCYGECNFCAIAVHEGRTVRSRSEASIVREAQSLVAHHRFRGVISDVGGPTANMYGFECRRKADAGPCSDRRCCVPQLCQHLRPDHGPQIRLLRRLRSLPGIRRVFVASGIRPDLVLADQRHGREYVRELAAHHVSGQVKLAPEHCSPGVLQLMGKPSPDAVVQFRHWFLAASRECGKKQFVTYYLIAAYPGCTDRDMLDLRRFCQQQLHLLPEQVQLFTPTPSTWASLMYLTGRDPASGRTVFVERSAAGRQRQKNIMTRRRQDRRGRR